MTPRAVAWVVTMALLITSGVLMVRRQRNDNAMALVDVVTKGSTALRTVQQAPEQPPTEPQQMPAEQPAAGSQPRPDPQPAPESEAVQRLKRFHSTYDHVSRQLHYGKHEVFTMMHCAEGRGIGMRPPNQQAPIYAGNTCEPWTARFAIVMLDQLLDTGMKALEWGTGSSTQWTLMRVGHLTSIEHDAGWAPAVQAAIDNMYDEDFLGQRWDSHVVRRGKPTKEGVEEYEDPASFRDYASASFLSAEAEGSFDYIAVDGRSRMLCLQRALKLLKPEGGILLLDNSDRSWYTEHTDIVPGHWLRFDDLMASKERTTIWMSCREGACGA